jgi:hypothetical protein
METAAAEAPVLSVIVPVRNGAETLPRCLEGLRASKTEHLPWELIVVDDGSTDASAEIAKRFADRLIPLATPLRAAGARNRGAKVARGEILVFVDADVCVHDDALREMHLTLAHYPEVSAVFGAYDQSPVAPDFLSQYRNLLHHYVHQREAGDTVTFWTGLGAIRRDVFQQLGGFDEAETLEDIELGYRLSARGHRILLRPEIQGTHWKRWTLFNMVLTDVRNRGIPWVLLLLARKGMIGRKTLNVRAGEQALTALVGLVLLSAAARLLSDHPMWLTLAALATGLIMLGNWPFTAWLAKHRGWWFAVRTIPLRLLYYALNVVSVCLALLLIAWRSFKPDPHHFALTAATPGHRHEFPGPEPLSGAALAGDVVRTETVE